MNKAMKKIVLILSMGVVFTGCINKQKEKQPPVSQGNVELVEIDESKVLSNDLLTGEKINYQHEMFGISEDGKRFKLNAEVGEKELDGFKGTAKSVKYIHEEGLEKSGTLAILNTNGEVYISNGGLFAPKIYMTKVDMREKVKAIAVTSSYKNKRGVVLMVTERDEIKAIDDESHEVYEFIEEDEKKNSLAYEKIIGNGEMWMPVFTINPETNEKVYFEEPVSFYMFTDRNMVNFEDNKNNTTRHGTYEIDVETNNVEITYDNDEKEILEYVNDLGDDTGYLKIMQEDGLERYYRN